MNQDTANKASQNKPIMKPVSQGAGKDITALVLAAGLGTRMKSPLAKVLHEVQSKPMILHVMDTIKDLGLEQTYVIVGHQREKVEELISRYRAECIVQEQQLGTGHAVLCAEKKLRSKRGNVLILSGDVPLIRSETLQAMLADHTRNNTPLTLMTTALDDPANYGRIVRDSNGKLLGIVEEKDATDEQKKIREINAGIYCAEISFLFDALKNVTTDNKQGEMYLTDIVKIAIDDGLQVETFSGASSEEVLGVNSIDELAEANRYLKKKSKTQIV
jgi:bifunctional UDP-N-acetylglucosamine pyrophosphorylase/glucosamine-1-phosphate N-acetyltransferase